MLDFVEPGIKENKDGTLTVYPDFIVTGINDMLIKGQRFYAVWDEEYSLWSKSENRAIELIDRDISNYAKKVKEENPDKRVKVALMKNFSSNMLNTWIKYCKSIPDNSHELDRNVIFLDDDVKKEDYASFKLDYNMQDGDISAYEELISTLYDESERRKIEWIIGSVIAGDSKSIQKFGVFYGGPGTGKSTILNIIDDMFQNHCSQFEAKELGRSGSSFAMETLSSNPLIAIDHDSDLSRVEDNTKLNSIISHERMVINEKFKSKYTIKLDSFLLIGTNKPVKITDSKSGLLRRLIDINPTGNTIPKRRYDDLMNQIKFEYGAIAYHCLQVYNKLGKNYYNGYKPISMMSTTNDFFSFMEDNYDFFAQNDKVSLNEAWLRYNEYATEAHVPYPLQKKVIKDELKSYFKIFKPRYDANKRNMYIGFKKELFAYTVQKSWDEQQEEEAEEYQNESWIKFGYIPSLLDEEFKDMPAQYATEDGIPKSKWEKVKTTLSDIDTSKLHYTKVSGNCIVIDFDLKDQNGEKSYELNLAAASKWPKTYAELSKSGSGIHLHYIYDGDVSRLSRLYAEDIEVKVFVGDSALRRQLTKCNDLPIAHINSNLPMKGVKPVLQDFTIKSERDLRRRIEKNLRKEVHSSTKCSMDFICKILDDAYEQGLKYDVRDMIPSIQHFALNSTHQSDYCLKLMNKMKFCSSEEPSENVEDYEDNKPIVFFDVEVFSNLFVVCWKKQGKENQTVKMINPSPSEVESLMKFRLIGFNNRRYDNHILYARMMGYTESELFKLSQRIIDGDRDAFFGEAYNMSYTDVYDFLSANNKMGLKKWEIKLRINHKECDCPWDQPAPEDRWDEIADYCVNDVIATEAVFDANHNDWLAREILADLAGLTKNDTTNNCTTRIIVGKDRNPQNQFIYTDLSTIFPGYEYDPRGIDKSRYNEGTKIVRGKSIYRGEDPGEGGYALGNPGMYTNVALLDVASMHPHSAIALKIFGEYYTKKYEELVEARIFIKHGEYDKVRGMFDGRIDKWLDDQNIKPKDLANALKTAINSVYGLTSASFPNKLRDPRNIDNIVAKYGALFMINLKHEVQDRGYTVVHIKTDSIKIANATPEIIQFCMEYAKSYGYTFEHEATYSKMCIVNDSVYIARYASMEWCQKKYGYVPSDIDEKHQNTWTATGDQFQVPYVFKTLFSHEPLEFYDMCETKSVSTALYLDMNENLGLDEHDYHFVGKIGLFCPVKPGCGGGVLLRKGDNGKYSAAEGTKKSRKVSKDEPNVYMWLEADVVQTLNKQNVIDKDYYNDLVDKAVEAISQYGDFEWFASDNVAEDLSWMEIPAGLPEEVPFDYVA